jgi:hypothetical protein
MHVQLIFFKSLANSCLERYESSVSSLYISSVLSLSVRMKLLQLDLCFFARYPTNSVHKGNVQGYVLGGRRPRLTIHVVLGSSHDCT